MFILTVSGAACWFHTKNTSLLSILFLIRAVAAFVWWKDMLKEGTITGTHNSWVNSNLQLGIILFISSEVLFFTAFFWAFFHRRISPTIELGQSWPPRSIYTFNPMNVPLLNTLILLSSGVSITYSHHALIERNKQERSNSIILTVCLGLLFTSLQGMEYLEAPYSLSDSVFGTTFFIATGFHGLHVIIGSTFLIVTFKRIMSRRLTTKHTTGFECAAWYWHFVDVVWLFLYTSIYWWGS